MSELTLRSTLKLNDGKDIPLLSLGVWNSSTCQKACLTALEEGYRSIDTAILYKNEEEVGKAVKASSLPRSSIYITTKIWDDLHTKELTSKAVDDSLKAMQLDYIDLYLIHNPRSGPEGRHQTWLALQEAQKAGKIKSIGVSNFKPDHIEILMKSEGVDTWPAANQIEMHPWDQQKEIRAYCKEKGIAVQAFSPLSVGKNLGDPIIDQISKKHGKTPAQVILRWHLQQDVIAIPKSENPGRIKENATLYDFALDQEDLDAIDKLDKGQDGNITGWNPWKWP